MFVFCFPALYLSINFDFFSNFLNLHSIHTQKLNFFLYFEILKHKPKTQTSVASNNCELHFKWSNRNLSNYKKKSFKNEN
jgi:hypothetical protein